LNVSGGRYNSGLRVPRRLSISTRSTVERTCTRRGRTYVRARILLHLNHNAADHIIQANGAAATTNHLKRCTLPQKTFIGRVEWHFQRRACDPSLSAAARNRALQGRIQGLPLKINLQGRAMAPPAPGNLFSGAAHLVSRPCK
jgi:hypothetical protein